MNVVAHGKRSNREGRGDSRDQLKPKGRSVRAREPRVRDSDGGSGECGFEERQWGY